MVAPMDKIWLKQYPEGIPAEISVDEYRSLKEILERSCRTFADHPAYGNMGVSITYRELTAPAASSAPTCKR